MVTEKQNSRKKKFLVSKLWNYCRGASWSLILANEMEMRLKSWIRRQIIFRMCKRQDPKRAHCSQVFTSASDLDTPRNGILDKYRAKVHPGIFERRIRRSVIKG